MKAETVINMTLLIAGSWLVFYTMYTPGIQLTTMLGGLLQGLAASDISRAIVAKHKLPISDLQRFISAMAALAAIDTLLAILALALAN